MSSTALPSPTNPGATAPDLLDAIQRLRSAGGALLAQAELHLQLARIEWAAEQTRLSQLVVVALLGYAGLLCTLLLVGALVLAFSWDTAYRIPAAIALFAICCVGNALVWRRLQTLSALGSQAFAATRAELAADIALLKSKL